MTSSCLQRTWDPMPVSNSSGSLHRTGGSVPVHSISCLQRTWDPRLVRNSNTNDMTGHTTAIGLDQEAIGLGQEWPWRHSQSFVTAWSLSLPPRSSLVHCRHAGSMGLRFQSVPRTIHTLIRRPVAALQRRQLTAATEVALISRLQLLLSGRGGPSFWTR